MEEEERRVFNEGDVEVKENTRHRKCTIRKKYQQNDEKEKGKTKKG